MEQNLSRRRTSNDWQAQQRVFEHMAFWIGDTEFNLVQQAAAKRFRASYIPPIFFLRSACRRSKAAPSFRKRTERRQSCGGHQLRFLAKQIGGRQTGSGKTVTLDTLWQA